MSCSEVSFVPIGRLQREVFRRDFVLADVLILAPAEKEITQASQVEVKHPDPRQPFLGTVVRDFF
jgi:hypothetical protein